MQSGDLEVVRVRLRATGRVQGVFYRDTLRRAAERVGVAGYARNMADGSVEAVLEGQRGAVDELVELARTGPPAANVDTVDVQPEQPQGQQGFTIG